MKITYDKEVDALYVYFKKGKVAKTVEVGANFIADTDKKGNIIGLEVLAASKYLVSKGAKLQVSIGKHSVSLPAFAR